MKIENHYKWLYRHSDSFGFAVGLKYKLSELITDHGDKCYGYRDKWEKQNIPFNHGVAIYLLSYCDPFSKEVRETSAGWVAPDDWVVSNYNRFKEFLV